MHPLKYLVVAAAVALGALFAAGCLLAALFEVQGFGGPRDQGPRTGYVVELAGGFAGCALIPVFLWRRLLGNGPSWIAAVVLAIVGVFTILGLSLSA